MSDLVQSVSDGIVQQTKTSTQKSNGSNLDKDAFLQLLTTQMKYQDPLNPSSNTEYVAQLATFSQLEQIQNLSTTTSNSQAFSLVGKNVIVKTENTAGNTSYVSGAVDFVNLSGGKAQLSINGSLYGVDQLDSIIDDTYIKEKNLPSISQQTALTYDATSPKNATFNVNLGTGDTVADDIAILINGNVVDSSLVSLSGTTVTIDKSAFKDLQNGSYKIIVAFNDSNYTAVKDKVTLQVKNAVASTTTNSTTDSTANTSSNNTTTTTTDSTNTSQNTTA